MLEAGSAEPPKETVENELATLSNNITSCLSAVSLKVGCDKETISCVEECVIATEELQTLGGLVRTDIKAVNDSVVAINEQIGQIESLFENIDRLEEFVKQKKEQLILLENELTKAEKLQKRLPDFIEIEEENDDSPIEVSSKIQREIPFAGNTSNLKEKECGNQEKGVLNNALVVRSYSLSLDKKVRNKIRRRKKYKVVKLNESVYKSETKTSTFKVVPLLLPPPQPSLNFRARLLEKRTKNQRLTRAEQAGLQHKNKWFAATRPARR
uniref:Biogenesis of lysosome-related organelles complex 1 subunit 8 n=1 Tax=Loa loa TaxID=7209 RepID=A0A1I7W4C5_LOALO